ncbi:MAG: TIGR03086 family metal-binding protein [Acidimicrobiales bacterium]
MDTTSLAKSVVDETTIVIDNIAPEQLGNTTPCAEWTVRDVLNHITNGAALFAMSADEGSVSDELMAQIAGGDDYKGAWKAATTTALAAAAKPGALERTVTLPFGEMSVGAFLNYVIFDLTTHATDLARATGQTVTNTDLLEAALEVGRQTVGPGMRQPGVFDSEQPVSADAPIIDRLQAFAGRRI